MRRYLLLVLFGSLALFLVACGSDDPEVNEGDIDRTTGYTINFDDEADFETGTYPGSGELRIADGEYTVVSLNPTNNAYLWGSNVGTDNPALKNVIIEVEARPSDGRIDNWYGVMCRVNEAGGGYAFLISGDGYWAIARSDGRSLFFLEQWRQAEAINQGNNTNTLQAYCLNNYLALYVNDSFLGDLTHDEDGKQIDRVGGVALLAGGVEGDQVVVHFDNLVVSEAQRSDAPNTPVPATNPPQATPTAETLPTLDMPSISDGTAPADD